MALVAKQDVCIQCDVWRVRDITHLYNDPDNLTGYGPPNQNFGDLTPYTAEFFPPKSTTGSYTLNFYDDPPAPDADENYVYLIQPDQTSADGIIKSGVWIIKVTIGDSVKEIAVLATGDIEKKVNACICGSGKEKLMLYMDLVAARYSFRCFDTRAAQEAIDDLYRRTQDCCGCSH